MFFANKSIVISGASRGIGKAIALKLARDGANITIASKTAEPHAKLEGTIYTAAQELREAGAKEVLPIQTDIRNEADVKSVMQEAANRFGGIDVLINNASAIALFGIEEIEMKRYDLMQDINVRGSFMMSKYAIPYLKKSANAHILNLSPPLHMDPKWFSQHLAYTISKYGMSMLVLGLSSELRRYHIAVNALWPKTLIATAAVRNLPGGESILQHSRNAAIVADAAYNILKRSAAENTGNFYIDEDVLREEGETDFTRYSVNPGGNLMPDLFL